jgi:hypothetical protein
VRGAFWLVGVRVAVMIRLLALVVGPTYPPIAAAVPLGVGFFGIAPRAWFSGISARSEFGNEPSGVR